MPTTEGKLVIFSGPSGAGKTSVLREVFARSKKPLSRSISATTRPPRQGEVDGKDYYFLTLKEFQKRRDAEEFLECFEVFGRGDWYGTLKSEVMPRLERGEWVVLEIDVQGAEQIKANFPAAQCVFIRPESTEDLRERLKNRGTETTEAIARRVAEAERELARASWYDYQVTNRDFETAVDEVCEILNRMGNKDD